MSNSLTCPNNCGHTDKEHEIFGDGFKAAQEGIGAVPYPETVASREIWHIGYSAGKFARPAQGEGE